MADLTRTLEVVFSGNKTDLDDTIAGVGRNVDGLTANIEGIAEPVSKITDGILALDAALLALVAGGLALAISKGGEFGDQFGEIATLIDVPRDTLEGFSQDILDYSRDSGKSIEDINAAIYTAISAGTDYADSLDLLAQTEKLSIAGRADLEATTKLVASTLNAYGESVDQAERYSDVFFTTVKDGQTTIPELATKLADVTGIAAAAEIPIETLAAAIAALTANGVPTAQAMTSIKAAISNIIKPSSEAQEMAASLGLEFNATALEAKGFDGILGDIYDATGGNIEQMGKLFGSTEALNAVLVLSADTSGKFKDALEDMAASGGATAAAWEKVKDDFSNINQQLANNVNATLIDIGLQIGDEYTKVAKGVISILQGIGTEIDDGTFDPLIDAVEKLGVNLADMLEGIAKAMPEAFDQVDFSGLLEALGDIGDQLGDLFGDIDLTDPEDLAKVIQKVIDTVESLITITGGIVESFKPFFDAILEGINHINKMDTSAQESFGNLLGAAKLVTEAGLEIVAALALVEQSGFSMEDVFDTVFGGVKITVNALQTAFDTWVSWLAEGVQKILELANLGTWGFIPGLDEATESVKEFITAVEQHRNEQVEEMAAGWDQVAGNIEKTAEAIDKIPDTTIANIEGSVDPALQDWADKANQGFSAEISIDVDPTNAGQAKTDIAAIGGATTYDEETGTWTNTVSILAMVDQTAADAVRTELEEEFALKMLELEVNFDIARLETEAETMQAALQFKAEVDVAEVEAAADIVEALSDSISTVFETTGDNITGLLDALDGLSTGSGEYNFITNAINDQLDMQQQALDLQEKLTESQVAYNNAKTELIESGDATISVTADGLEAELEAFMFKILERVQLRVTAEQAEFLLGVGGL